MKTIPAAFVLLALGLTLGLTVGIAAVTIALATGRRP